MKKILTIISLFFFIWQAIYAQDTTRIYKKRVLENTEIDFLISYYEQEGDHAAVTGGVGDQELTDFYPVIIVSTPLNDDDVLSIEAGYSSYTSASSGKVDPFEGDLPADAFVTSSGSSRVDSWINLAVSYALSSDDRNKIWSANISGALEYDYTSIGFGGGYTRLFNEKNTEISIKGNIFLDTWSAIYPIELRSFDGDDKLGVQHPFFSDKNIVNRSNPNTGIYAPSFDEFSDETRNTYAASLSFSQILSKRLQGILLVDLISQDGLLSTPFHRINFADKDDFFIQEFQLADAVETLPDTRFKVAVGGRLNYFVNQYLVLRSYLRYYDDDWGVSSITGSIEAPIKISKKWTIIPGYRYYDQNEADYFAGKEEHLSTAEFFTSDVDLSEYTANQYSIGVTYTDVFTKAHLGRWGVKSLNFKFSQYDRDTEFSSYIIAGGVSFVVDKK